MFCVVLGIQHYNNDRLEHFDIQAQIGSIRGHILKFGILGIFTYYWFRLFEDMRDRSRNRHILPGAGVWAGVVDKFYSEPELESEFEPEPPKIAPAPHPWV